MARRKPGYFLSKKVNFNVRHYWQIYGIFGFGGVAISILLIFNGLLDLDRKITTKGYLFDLTSSALSILVK